MKLILHVMRTNPNGVEEIQMEDVASLSLDDTAIHIKFNKSEDEIIPLRTNDGKNIQEWSAFSLVGTRIGLKIDI